MARAIKMAREQMGRTWPNPAVGCVLVRDGIIIAEGATGDGGRPHAEEVALDAAGGAVNGATAYVTLEPCGARSNGCASCSERLIAAGVSRIVYACADPSPYASHAGPARMKAAGLTVEQGLMAKDAESLIEGWLHFLKTGLPLVRLSDTSDGFDAEFTGSPDTLKEWAARGYRRLYVRPGSEAALALGLTEKSQS